MKKIAIVVFIVLILGVSLTAFNKSSWRYKMTVAVETPEGIKTGSVVREMSNSNKILQLPDVGNPALVKGEAVVVDLGERGVLFALISHESDNEFYNAFPSGRGGSTAEGIKYYASLPVGKKNKINPKRFPSYPKLVTFTDMNDPKSVTLIQKWERDKRGYYYLKEDRFEELFGKGVKLKDITLEITDEPMTWGRVDKFIPLGSRQLNMTYSYFSRPNEK